LSLLNEIIGLSEPQFIGFFLALLRISSLIVVAPVLGSQSVPARVKIFLALLLTLVILPAVKSEPEIGSLTMLSLFPLAIKEIVLGLFLGFIAKFMFEGFQFAGTLISTQMGLGMAQLVDPESGSQTSPIGNIYSLTAIMLFLLFNGHHLVLSALFKTFEMIPVSRLNVIETAAKIKMTTMFNDLFAIGIKLAAPSMVTLFLIEACMGIMARIVPQMNIFFIGLPLRLAVGLFILIGSLPVFYLLFESVLAAWKRDITGILIYL
jgi:flagellar biosynthetic protein FliR